MLVLHRATPALGTLTRSTAVCALFAAAFVAAADFSPPAQAIQWCDPSSPLYDPTVCYNETHRGGYSCDPYGPAYNQPRLLRRSKGLDVAAGVMAGLAR
jgi:hypothetical protein